MEDFFLKVFMWGIRIIWGIGILFGLWYSLAFTFALVCEVGPFMGLFVLVFEFFLLCPVIVILINLFKDD